MGGWVEMGGGMKIEELALLWLRWGGWWGWGVAEKGRWSDEYSMRTMWMQGERLKTYCDFVLFQPEPIYIYYSQLYFDWFA